VFTSAYWRDLAERMISTGAQSVLAAYGLDALNLLSLDWRAALGLFLGGMLLSLLKGLAARAVTNPESASLVTTAPTTVTVVGTDPDASGH